MQENLQKNLDGVFNEMIAGIGVIYTSAKVSEYGLRAKKPSQEVIHLINVFQDIQKECDHLCELMGVKLP